MVVNSKSRLKPGDWKKAVGVKNGKWFTQNNTEPLEMKKIWLDKNS